MRIRRTVLLAAAMLLGSAGLGQLEALAPGAGEVQGVRWTAPQPVAQGELQEYPDVAVDASDQAWVTWVGMPDGREHVYVRSYRGVEAGATQDIGIASGLQFAPRIIASGNRVWVAWSTRGTGVAGEENRWQLVVRQLEGDVVGPPEVISSPGEDALRPALGLDAAGEPWVAWESRVGRRFRVMARALTPQPGRPAPVEVGTEGELNLRPAVTSAPGGGVYVLWDQYDRGEYQVYARRVQSSAGPLIRVSHEPAVNVGVSATTDSNGRVWIAYATNSDDRGGQQVGKTLRVKALIQGALRELEGGHPPKIFTAPGRLDAIEFPTMKVDSEGRVWVFARRGQGWIVMRYEGSRWSPPIDLSDMGWGGRGRELRAAWSADGFHLASRRLHMLAHQLLVPPASPARQPELKGGSQGVQPPMASDGALPSEKPRTIQAPPTNVLPATTSSPESTSASEGAPAAAPPENSLTAGAGLETSSTAGISAPDSSAPAPAPAPAPDSSAPAAPAPAPAPDSSAPVPALASNADSSVLAPSTQVSSSDSSVPASSISPAPPEPVSSESTGLGGAVPSPPPVATPSAGASGSRRQTGATPAAGQKSKGGGKSPGGKSKGSSKSVAKRGHSAGTKAAGATRKGSGRRPVGSGPASGNGMAEAGSAGGYVLGDGVGTPRPALRSSNLSRVEKGTDAPISRAPGIFFGDLHTHTWLSDGAGDPDEVYTRSRDRYRYDYLAVTDHDLENGNRILPSEWAYLKLLAELFYEADRFVTFVAYEWTSPSYPKGAGHRNVYFPGSDGPLYNTADVAPDSRSLFDLLKREGAIASPHHIGWTGTDWENHDPDVQRVVEIVSVHGAFEKPGNKPVLPRAELAGMFVRDGLLRGLKFGLMGGSDGHGFPWHYGVSRKADVWRTGLTGLLAPSLNREALFAALRNRQSIATSGAPIAIRMTVNGQPIGSELEVARDPRFNIRVDGTAALKEVTLIRDGEDIHTFTPQGRSFETSLTDDPSPGEHFYYLRVIQHDREVAWASPVWVELKGRILVGPPDP